jgi:hypothetical protein
MGCRQHCASPPRAESLTCRSSSHLLLWFESNGSHRHLRVTLFTLAQSRLRRFERSHGWWLRLAASERRGFHSRGEPSASRLARPVHSLDTPCDTQRARDFQTRRKPLSITLSRISRAISWGTSRRGDLHPRCKPLSGTVCGISRDNSNLQRCDRHGFHSPSKPLTSRLARSAHSREISCGARRRRGSHAPWQTLISWLPRPDRLRDARLRDDFHARGRSSGGAFCGTTRDNSNLQLCGGRGSHSSGEPLGGALSRTTRDNSNLRRWGGRRSRSPGKPLGALTARRMLPGLQDAYLND